MKRVRIAVVGVVFLLLATPAWALIMRLTPLKSVVEESQFVLTVKVESVDADKPAMVLTVDEEYKGKAPFKKMVVALKGDEEATKGKQLPDLLKRVAPKLPLVLFVSQRDTKYIAFAYTNGTWFQLTGTKDDDSDTIRWSFTHLEPYLRRTYKGTSPDLQKALAEYINDKKALPDTDAKEKPGLGPEVEPEKKDKEDKSTGTVTTGPVFAVVPAVLIGGPLALLAMLFPSVFGGWKRWLTLLSVACTNSTLYTLQFFFAPELAGTIWGNSLTLWIAMALVTLAGLVWAFQRHYVRVMEGEAPFAPSRIELVVLGVVSLIGLGVIGYVRFNHQSLLSAEWKPVLPYCIAAWGAAAYVAYAYVLPRRLPALATEVVMLAIMAFATTGLLATGQRAGGFTPTAAANEAQPHLVWQFTARAKGSISSTPLVVGERVYVGVANEDFFSPTGTLYCLDRATGQEVWAFDNKKTMRQIHSTPCVHDGKLYIGEGLHQDAGCKLFCLDAATGDVVWTFTTESHTESSPCVVDGKVYFGAGDDGLYCVEATTGKKLWNFPGYHVDASPVVVDKRVFVGAGVGDIYKEPAVLCVNAENGLKEWLVKTDLPVWGSPTVSGGLVYFGLGNGRIGESDSNPKGALLCVHTDDGSEAFRCKTGDSVLGQAAVDAYHVYFGSSDGKFYCLQRKTGQQCWQQNLRVPGDTITEVVAAPVLVPSPHSDAPLRILVLGSTGQMLSLDPVTGNVAWSRDLQTEIAPDVQLLSQPVLEAAREDAPRRFYVAGTIGSTGHSAVLCCYELLPPKE